MLFIRWQARVSTGRLVYQILLPANLGSWSLKRLWHVSEARWFQRRSSGYLIKDYHCTWAKDGKSCRCSYHHMEGYDDQGTWTLRSGVQSDKTYSWCLQYSAIEMGNGFDLSSCFVADSNAVLKWTLLSSKWAFLCSMIFNPLTFILQGYYVWNTGRFSAFTNVVSFLEENHEYKLRSQVRQSQQVSQPGRPSQDMMSFWGQW